MAKAEKKQPWFKFYPSDWAGDRKLRMCSIAARGLWVELLCVMHEAEPYGHLVTDGRSVTNRQIAALAGITAIECGRFMAELESAGVYSRTDDKTIFSRRMVRDKAKADQDRKNGKGGGNPIITGEDNRGVNPPDNGVDKAQSPEASSRTSESIIKTRERPLSDLDSRSEKDRPTLIDEKYQPSDAAVEYAYSCKMKRVDLESELSKFRNHCIGLRIASYNPDANFKKWCDQWADYQRKNAKPASTVTALFEPQLADFDKAVKAWMKNESSWPRWAGNSPGGPGCLCPEAIILANGIDPDSGMRTTGLHFLEVGTTELNAHLHDREIRKVRPPTIRTIIADGVEKTGAYLKHKVPHGYDETTGGRLPPQSEEEENAA